MQPEKKTGENEGKMIQVTADFSLGPMVASDNGTTSFKKKKNQQP